MSAIFPFNAFLSHKYEYPEVNLFFFKLFNAQNAQVRFELDAGKGATNVTRLEIMIRRSHAFIGIYPFLGILDEKDRKKQLLEQSKYFRLEMELAIRSRKPAIIFYDKRYGEMVKPPGVLSFPFDIDEITGKGESPNLENFQNEFIKFQELLKFNKAYEDRMYREKNTIAVFVPPSPDGINGYTSDAIENIKSILADKTDFEVQTIAANPVLDMKQLRFLATIEFALVDVGAPMMQTGLPAYLHGRFIPTVRLNFQNNDADAIGPPLSNSFLFGGIEAGYPKDILCWNTIDFLKEKLNARLDRINAATKPIGTYEEAVDYFNSAAIKNKSVFLSYAGEDEDAAQEFVASLKKRFKTIFNYKDTVSIPGSASWLEVIFDRIANCDVFISLYSAAYFKSTHCEPELQHGVTQKYNGKKILVYPVKLYKDEKFDIPEYAASIQYVRKYQFKNADEIIEEIMKKLPD